MLKFLSETPMPLYGCIWLHAVCIVLTTLDSLCQLSAFCWNTNFILSLTPCLSQFETLAFTTSHFFPSQYKSCQTLTIPSKRCFEYASWHILILKVGSLVTVFDITGILHGLGTSCALWFSLQSSWAAVLSVVWIRFRSVPDTEQILWMCSKTWATGINCFIRFSPSNFGTDFHYCSCSLRDSVTFYQS